MKLKIAVPALIVCALFAGPAQAVNISLYNPGNQGITSIRYTVSGSIIDIYENWGSTANGDLLVSGLAAGANYTVRKHITNNSSKTWTRFACELLDPIGNLNDEQDPFPYPDWVPYGFSTSNDLDGLSFAQGAGIDRTSQHFSQVYSDEFTYRRDFLDYYGGTVGSLGGTDLITFGLRDRNPAANQPFILSQRPNGFSVQPLEPPPSGIPEPRTLGLVGLGLAGAAGLWRRKA